MNEKIFTKTELARFNGQDGAPAYVAVNGTVYDVTNISAWANGRHHGHTAGHDVTAELKAAPHGDKVLSKLTAVGKLSE